RGTRHPVDADGGEALGDHDVAGDVEQLVAPVGRRHPLALGRLFLGRGLPIPRAGTRGFAAPLVARPAAPLIAAHTGPLIARRVAPGAAPPPWRRSGRRSPWWPTSRWRSSRPPAPARAPRCAAGDGGRACR